MSSYEALYRKYRPQTFADLAGQDPVANTLRNEIRDGRLTHAYLFTGPRGTGKTTTARLLAKALNCDRGPTVDPCSPQAGRQDAPAPAAAAGECPQCRAIRQGNHLDVVEIDAASNRGIEDIRTLQERVRLAPVQGRSKVFIIDEVHMLTDPAWNALLKTLEEPPPSCVFVLATTEVHKVLPTVLSRCQRFDFQRIGHGALLSRLEEVARCESLVVDAEALDAIARRADGGLRDALSLLDQVAAGLSADPQGRRLITAEAVVDALGLIPSERILALGDALADRDLPRAIAGCTDLLAAGHDHRAIVRELLVWARNALLLQLAPDQADALEIPPGQRDRLGAHARVFSRLELLWVLEVLRDTDQTLKGSPQATIWLEMGLLRLCERMDLPGVADLAARVAALEARLAGGSVPVAAPSPARPAPATPPARPTPPAAPRPASSPAPAAAQAVSGEGGAFEMAQQADALGSAAPARPRTSAGDALEALKDATRSLRVSLRSNFDQFVTGSVLKPDGTLIVHMRQDTLFKEGSEGYKALLPIVRQHFGEGTRLEVTTAPVGPVRSQTAVQVPDSDPAPSQLVSPPPPVESSLVEPPIAPPLASPPQPQPQPPSPQASPQLSPPPPASHDDPVSLASELLLGKVVEG